MQKQKTIGLTGGIGSGKSTVAKMLANKGIPVYYSDIRAKEIMVESPKIISTLTQRYGEDIYIDGELNRKKLAHIVFNDKTELQKLNALVHPEVFNDFENWRKKQNADFIIKENAILFESGAYKDCDIIVTVSADKQIRLNRTIARDNSTAEAVEARMDKQWTDAQKEEIADYIIYNNKGLKELEKEVDKFYTWLNG